MADIFGRDSYAHLDALGDRSSALDYLNRRAVMRKHAPLNFEEIDPAFSGHTRAIDESNALGYTQTNWESIEAVVEEILYQNYDVRDFVPVNTQYPEGTMSVPIRVTDYAGEAVPIVNDGSNVQNVDLTETLAVVPGQYMGIKATLKNKEVWATMQQGIPLQMRSVQGATYLCIQKITEIVMTGANLRNQKGLINQDTGPGDGQARDTAASAAFSAMTADQWETDLQNAIMRVVQDTQGVAGEVFGGELVVLGPPDTVGKIGSLRIDHTDATVWDFVMRNNAWTALRPGNSVTIRSSIYCSAANNPGATKDRIAVYPKSEYFCEFFEIITPRIANQIQTDYGVSLPFEFDVTPLHVARPDALQYLTSA